jgi:hypothetical protein
MQIDIIVTYIKANTINKFVERLEISNSYKCRKANIMEAIVHTR